MKYNYIPAYSEVDSMGVIHHSRHIIWFENARFEFLENILKIERFEFSQMNIYMPVIELNCKYYKSLFFEDYITIFTKMYYSKVGRFSFKYWIYADENYKKLAVEGYTKHVFVNHNYQLLLHTPKSLQEKIMKAQRTFPESLILE